MLFCLGSPICVESMVLLELRGVYSKGLCEWVVKCIGKLDVLCFGELLYKEYG